MKRTCLAALLALMLSVPCASEAADTGYYAAPKLVAGLQKADWKYLTPSDSGEDSSSRGVYGFSLAGGYDFSLMYALPIRAEVEYGFNSKSDKHFSGGESELGIQTLMVNAYWDITNVQDFTPYVGAGIGLAFLNTSCELDGASYHVRTSDTSTELAAHIGFGCSYFISSNMSADLGYRYLFTGEGSSGYGGWSMKAEAVRMHQISLGVRISF